MFGKPALSEDHEHAIIAAEGPDALMDRRDGNPIFLQRFVVCAALEIIQDLAPRMLELPSMQGNQQKGFLLIIHDRTMSRAHNSSTKSHTTNKNKGVAFWFQNGLITSGYTDG